MNIGWLGVAAAIAAVAAPCNNQRTKFWGEKTLEMDNLCGLSMSGNMAGCARTAYRLREV